MPDMLVKLYKLQDISPLREKAENANVCVRRCIPMECDYVTRWVEDHFPGWGTQCKAAFFHQPPSVFIAVCGEEIVGFACYDATFPNSFGPTGVLEQHRGKHIGGLLLMECMYAMKNDGYRYAIIGDAGPRDYYRKTVGAVDIEGQLPATIGVFR